MARRRLLTAAQWATFLMPPELVRHVAPLGWEHIGLTGDYVWDAEPLPTEGIRPLRRAVSMLAA
jgi:hypothetical protein